MNSSCVGWMCGCTKVPGGLTASKAKEFSLAGVAEKIRCPVLITHGENDRVVPVQAARDLYAALKAPKTLKIFTPEEGGAEHCQVDDRPLGIGFIADWLAASMR